MARSLGGWSSNGRWSNGAGRNRHPIPGRRRISVAEPGAARSSPRRQGCGSRRRSENEETIALSATVPPIVTRRLELVSLGPDEIRALLAPRGPGRLRVAEFIAPDDFAPSERTLRMRLAQMEADPSHRPWLLRAIVERESRVMCGRIGFHTPPAPAYLAETVPDGVELGYEVAPDFRRRGYATEAALGLIRWAFDVHGQRTFVLSISPANAASLAMARALGFTECGSQMDDEDGLELQFVRRLTAWPPEWDARDA